MNDLHPDFQRQRSFVPDVMPWLIGVAALLVYLVTLNHWVTLGLDRAGGSLQLVGQVGGWDWPQNSLGALLFLATYPFRWLPAAAQPVALNLFSAVCGALTLMLLARSVALLPHDRTQAQREREQSEYSLLAIPLAWLPPVLAVLACGLQLSFWENAVAATGQMLDLLCIAFAIRCLLEFRLDGRESRLLWGVLVLCADASDYWLAAALLPAFLLAVLWTKGVAFFNFRFLLRMAGAGLAGLSLYLLMPLVQTHTTGTPYPDYWSALYNILVQQKFCLREMRAISPWILGLTSFLPLLLMSVRWKSSFGDTSPLGIALAAFAFHVMYGVFLLVCWWVAFDPPFGPRIFPRQYGLGLPLFLLPFSYISALCVGYYSGYFLLVFGRRPNGRRNSSPMALLITAAVGLMLIATPAGLLWKNFPQIHAINSRTLPEFASSLVEHLPKQGALVLADADDWQIIDLVTAKLREQGGNDSPIVLNTGFLKRYPGYHLFLAGQYPSRWDDSLAKTNPPDTVLPTIGLLSLLEREAQHQEIYYLHPSFGYYFERFYPVPRGLVNQLKLYPTNTVLPPALTDDDLAASGSFWQEQAGTISALTRQVAENERLNNFFSTRNVGPKLLHLSREPDWTAEWVGLTYSHALDNWGVILQQNGRLADAARCFQQAQDLNPENISAQINLAYNQVLQSGTNTPLQLSKSQQEGLAKYQNGPQLLAANGPLDEPQFCFQQAMLFTQGGLYREAAQEFDRVKQLEPDNLNVRLWLCEIYNTLHLPDETLKMARAIRAMPETDAATNGVVQGELVTVEAGAYLAKNEPGQADLVIQNALGARPDDPRLLDAVFRIYLFSRQYTNALNIIQSQLKMAPDNATALVNQGYINLQLHKYSDAIPPLDRAITMEPTNSIALLDRAVANLESGQFDDAQRDYEMLETLQPDSYQIQIHYGLGEVAYHNKDVTNAISNYEFYLTNSASTNNDEFKTVAARLKELKAKSP
jgi:tetratricopeptide (TPR) repeat protein